MVAYSFKQRFAQPILLGLEPGPLQPGAKRQTIRADRKRHARPGEEIQLYTGMRTRACRLLGRVICADVSPICLSFGASPSVQIGQGTFCNAVELDAFARDDGFVDWADLARFWASEHGQTALFHGVLIRWEPKP
jgi:hypothetical protein